jgi:hypothetical protein
MRSPRSIALLLTMLLLSGCRNSTVPPEQPMPPNTVLLSHMMRELTAAHPDLTEQLLSQLDRDGKKGPALLTPRLIDELRKRILGKDWSGLDRFPGWTMREITPTVGVINHFAGDSKSNAQSNPGASAAAAGDTGNFLDLGPYTLDHPQTIALDQPSPLPPFSTAGIVSDLGDGVIRGDGPNDLAAEHARSQQLADLLNRLAVNQFDNTQPLTVTLAPGHAPATTPEQLITLLQQTGHTVTVIDARYFANFGHLHYQPAGASQPQDVMMPFWVNTRLSVPHSGGLFHRARPLLVPVSHAEYEWQIRGPHLNADISYYFGIDGKAEWRTMDTLDQAWVLKRAAHTYTGAQAVEVTRLASLLTLAYMHLHQRWPQLPFGGYFTLGVCQDGVSAIEQRMTGHVTLFPNTADDTFFTDPRDTEINAMMRAIPKDRNGAAPEPERIFGSLPAAPSGIAGAEFNAITIPGIAADLNATYAAWQQGTLSTTQSWMHRMLLGLALAAIAAAAAAIIVRTRQHS